MPDKETIDGNQAQGSAGHRARAPAAVRRAGGASAPASFSRQTST